MSHETLFSLELLIDHIRFDRERVIHPAVAVRFLDFPTLLIHQPRTESASKSDDGVYFFHKGKSCVFKINVDSLRSHLRGTPLYVMLLDVTEEIPKLLGSSSVSLAKTTESLRSDGESLVSSLCNLMGHSIGSVAFSYRIVRLGENPPGESVTRDCDVKTHRANTDLTFTQTEQWCDDSCSSSLPPPLFYKSNTQDLQRFISERVRKFYLPVGVNLRDPEEGSVQDEEDGVHTQTSRSNKHQSSCEEKDSESCSAPADRLTEAFPLLNALLTELTRLHGLTPRPSGQTDLTLEALAVACESRIQQRHPIDGARVEQRHSLDSARIEERLTLDSPRVHQRHPIDSSQTHQHPRYSSQIHQHPIDSSQTHQHPIDSSQTHQHPIDSSQTHQHPRYSSQIHQHPIDSSQTHQHPRYSSQTHQHPIDSSRIHQQHQIDSSQIHQHPKDSARIRQQRPTDSTRTPGAPRLRNYNRSDKVLARKLSKQLLYGSTRTLRLRLEHVKSSVSRPCQEKPKVNPQQTMTLSPREVRLEDSNACVLNEHSEEQESSEQPDVSPRTNAPVPNVQQDLTDKSEDYPDDFTSVDGTDEPCSSPELDRPKSPVPVQTTTISKPSLMETTTTTSKTPLMETTSKPSLMETTTITKPSLMGTTTYSKPSHVEIMTQSKTSVMETLTPKPSLMETMIHSKPSLMRTSTLDPSSASSSRSVSPQRRSAGRSESDDLSSCCSEGLVTAERLELNCLHVSELPVRKLPGYTL